MRSVLALALALLSIATPAMAQCQNAAGQLNSGGCYAQQQIVAQPMYAASNLVVQQRLVTPYVQQQQIVAQPYVQQQVVQRQVVGNYGYGASANIVVQPVVVNRQRLLGGNRGRTVTKSRIVTKTR